MHRLTEFSLPIVTHSAPVFSIGSECTCRPPCMQRVNYWRVDDRMMSALPLLSESTCDSPVSCM